MKRKVVGFILIIIAVLASLSGIDLLVRMAYALILVLVLNYLWVRLNLRSLEAEVVRNREALQVGQWLEEEVTLRNPSILPKLLVEVRGNADLPGQGNTILVSLLPRSSWHWKTRTRCHLRGHYALAPLTVVSEDVFGLFCKQRSLGEPQKLIVYPATLELPNFLSASADLSSQGQTHNGSEQSAPSVSGLREYHPGDSLRHVHWPSTARTQRLMVKEFNTGSLREVWLVLDLNRMAQAGSGTESTEEYGVTIAASIAKRCWETNQSLGFIGCGDQHYLFPPGKGRHNLWKLLEILASVKALGCSTLTEVVSAHANRFGPGSTAVLITPSYGDLRASGQRLGQKGVRTVSILLDPGSFGGSPIPSEGAAWTTNGAKTYVVRRGDDIARVLSSGKGSGVRVGIGERERRS